MLLRSKIDGTNDVRQYPSQVASRSDVIDRIYVTEISNLIEASEQIIGATPPHKLWE